MAEYNLGEVSLSVSIDEAQAIREATITAQRMGDQMQRVLARSLSDIPKIKLDSSDLDRVRNFRVNLNTQPAQQELDRLRVKAFSVESAMRSVFHGFFASIGGSMFGTLKNSLDDVGRAVSGSVDLFTEFQGKINQFATFNSSASTQQIKALADEAKRLGIVTSTTAIDVGEAAVQLTKVGLNATQTKEQLEGVVRLSEATGLKNFGKAAEVAGVAFSVFGIETKKSADVISTVVSNIGGSAEDFLQLFSKTGAIAKQLNIPIEELSVAFGLLRQSGFSAQAGATGLKVALMNLAAPNTVGKNALKQLGIDVFDAGGRMKSLMTIIQEFRGRLAGLSDEGKSDISRRIFGTQGGPAFLALLSQSDQKITSLLDKVNNSQGNAQRSAGKMLAGLPGAKELLGGSLEGLQINFGEAISPALESIVRTFGESISKLASDTRLFEGLSAGAKQFSDYLKATPQIAEALYQTFSKLSTAIGSNIASGMTRLIDGLKANPEAIDQLLAKTVELAKSIGSITVAAANFGIGMTQGLANIINLVQPILTISSSLTGMSASSIDLMQTFGQIAAYALVIGGITSAVSSVIAIASNIGSMATGITALTTGTGALAGVFAKIGVLVSGIGLALSPYLLTIGAIVAVGGAAVLIFQNWEAITRTISNLWSGLITTLGNITQSIDGALSKSNVFSGVWNGIKSVLAFLIRPYTDIFNLITITIGRSENFRNIWSGLIGTIASVGNAIKNSLGGALSFVIDKATQFMDSLRAISGQPESGNLSADDSLRGSNYKLTAAVAKQSGINNPYAQAAIAGTIQQESNFDPDARESGGTGNGRGLMQWDVRDRAKGVVKMDASGNPTGNQFHEQLRAGIVEMSKDYKTATGRNFKADLNSARSTEEAMAVMQKTIRFGEGGNRNQYAKDALSTIQSKSPSKLEGSISGTVDASGQNGADMPTGPNGEMKSYQSGKIIQKGTAGNNGNYVVVKFQGDDGKPYEATYSHVSSKYKVGDSIQAGQVIGKFDGSGRTMGAHNSVDINTPGTNGALQRNQESPGARRQADLLAQGNTAGSPTTQSSSSSIELPQEDVETNYQKAVDLNRSIQDKNLTAQRESDRKKRQQERDAQVLSINRQLASTNNPEARASLEDRRNDLTLGATEQDKIDTAKLERADLVSQRSRKVQDLKSPLPDVVERAKNSPDYSAAIKSIDAYIARQETLRNAALGTQDVEQRNKESLKELSETRIAAAASAKNAYEQQRASLENRKAQSENQGNPALGKDLDIQLQRLELQYRTNSELEVERNKLADLTKEREAYAKTLSASGSKDATLTIMDTQLKSIQGNIQSIQTVNAQRSEIITAQEVQNSRELAENLKRVNQTKTANIEDSRLSVAKAFSGRLRDQGKDRAADQIDEQIALQEQKMSRAEALLKLEQDISEAEKNGAAYTTDQVTTLRSNIEALNSINTDGIKSKFDEMGNAMKSVSQEFQNSLGSGIKDLISGTKSLGQVFNDVLGNMASKFLDLGINSLMRDLFGGGQKQGGGGGGLLSGVLGLFGGGSAFPNFAEGNLADVMKLERSQSGFQPQLAVVNSKEIILSASQSKRFMDLGMDKQLRNYSTGNLDKFSSRSAPTVSAPQITVPITINTTGGGEKPSIDPIALKEVLKAEIHRQMLDAKRNGSGYR